MSSLLKPSEWRILEGTCYEVGHTWNSSCLYANLELGCFVFYEGVKLYLPLYLCSELIEGRWSPWQWLRVLPHVLRSAMFLSSNMACSHIFMCLFRHLIGRFYYYSSVFLPSCLGTGCALLVERKSRRSLLAGYVATVAIEFTFSMLKSKRYVKALPYGEVTLFSLAMSVLFYNFRCGPKLRSADAVNSILRTLVTPPLPLSLTRHLQSSVLDNRWTRILLVGVWAFLLGYLLQCLLSLLHQGSRLFTKKGKLRECLGNRDNIRLGACLSALAAGYKLVSALLYRLPLPAATRTLLAGFVAGLSLLFYRSSSIALYVAWKAIEVLYSRGVGEGWLRHMPNVEVLIYAISTGWLFHGVFFEGHYMRQAYWDFLRKVTRGRILQFNYDELDKFGSHASTRVREWRDKEWKEGRDGHMVTHTNMSEECQEECRAGREGHVHHLAGMVSQHV